MILLTAPEVVSLHEKIVAATGGLSGVRDNGLLESAIMSCYQSFGDTELYPTVIDKAARAAYTICKNHPFADGNKRTAIAVMLVILRVNDINLSYTQKELITLGLGIADGTIEYESIVKWVHSHRSES